VGPCGYKEKRNGIRDSNWDMSACEAAMNISRWNLQLLSLQYSSLILRFWRCYYSCYSESWGWDTFTVMFLHGTTGPNQHCSRWIECQHEETMKAYHPASETSSPIESRHHISLHLNKLEHWHSSASCIQAAVTCCSNTCHTDCSELLRALFSTKINIKVTNRMLQYNIRSAGTD
jgi:hypothetical protein